MIETVTFDQLRTFITVCDEGSFSSAARKLRRTQSGISRAIDGLESSLDIKLFDRSGYKPKLTREGEIVLLDARTVIERMQELKAHVANLATEEVIEINLALHSSIPIEFLVQAVKKLESRAPGLHLTVLSGPVGEVIDLVVNGTCNIGICAIPPDVRLPPRARTLSRSFLANSMRVVVAAPKHPLFKSTGLRPLPLSELRRHVRLVLTDRTEINTEAERSLPDGPLWRLADLHSKRELLLAGIGWASMPQHLVREDLASRRLREVPVVATADWQGPVPVYLIHKDGYRMNQHEAWLGNEIKAILKKLIR